MAWIESWMIAGASGKQYKVSRDDQGRFGCACRAWKFCKAPKQDCQHIMRKKIELLTAKELFMHPAPKNNLLLMPKAKVTIAFNNPETYVIDILALQVGASHQLKYHGKIAAIKFVRQQTGWLIAQCKAYVDDLETGAIQPQPAAPKLTLQPEPTGRVFREE